jgi:16S rRNA (adenine1518-N6/adenine1519-N6)-dimethyltransferase
VITSNLASIRPKKSLGQHFLRDGNIARKIVAAIGPGPDDIILEIGPGEGSLTKHLAPRVRRVIAVEIDSRIAGRLREEYAGSVVEVLHGDFLATDLARMAGAYDAGMSGRMRIVGNIPYNITSPILFHILDNRTCIGDATIMMQKEVARRLVAHAGTKDYGILAVFCQLCADVRVLFDVSPSAFFPKPKVTSSVVRLRMLAAPRYALADEQFFRGMVRAVFGKRRKTLRNSLKPFVEANGLHMPEDEDLSRRPEDLSIQQLVALGNTLFHQQ